MEGFKKVKNILLFGLILAIAISAIYLKIQQDKKSKLDQNKDKVDVTVGKDENTLAKIGGTGQIKKFGTYDEVKQFLESQQANTPNYSMMVKGTGASLDMARPAMEATANAGIAPSAVVSDAAGVTNDFSKTNVQIAGVDEADIIKTDGNYIYAVSYNTLYIIKAYPGESSEIVSQVEFKSRPTDLYINGNNLAVFGYDDQIYTMDFYRSFRRQNQYTFFKVFDISDKKNPTQVRDLNFEGSYFNSRMIGDYVYFVTNNYNYSIGPEPVVPRVLDSGVALAEKCEGANVKCFSPNIYYFDIPYDSYNFTTISAINIKNNSEKIGGDVYLLSSTQNMFVSPENLYITYTKYISEYDLEMQVSRELLLSRLSDSDRTRIAKIEEVADDILSQNEKKAKVQQVLERYLSSLTSDEQVAYEKELAAKMKQKYTDLSKELEKTIVHKIAISGSSLQYKSSGEVTGSVLNQFAMDENNGYFRIATTRNATWSRFEGQEKASYNNLYVLDADMKTVGTLENLAEGERIYSVRFMGNRAYLVTFKQVDPLFAIDLSDVKNPKVLGQLKVPGFSNYLHPYDENTLIGFGKDAGENEYGNTVAKGLKISLFDVSDVSSPKELDKYLMGDMGSDSVALYDHKAFLFSKEKDLLVLPVALRKSSGQNQWGEINFSGAMVFSLKDKKINYTGKIDHSDGGAVSTPDYFGGVNYYDNSVKRSLYIENNLYTLSNNYLKVNTISDLKDVKKIELKKGVNDDFKVIN
ncbi:MAG: beta-propeller domain-containing protein [Candidatus Falkowbacteria bacterium]